MSAPRMMLRLRSVLVWLCLLALSSLALAQTEATPIQIGQNAFGELTADANIVQYAVVASGGETAAIQILALSSGFAPRFRVTNPAGVEVFVMPNPDGLNSLTGSVSFPDAGTYTIEIVGENGTLGQYALSLQPGASLPPLVELVINQSISDSVGSQSPVKVYHFSTTPDAFTLTILSEAPNAGALVSLFDEDAGKTVATNDAGVSGIAYRLSPEAHTYRVEVRAGSAGDTAFSICLGACSSSLLSDETSAEPNVVTVNQTPEVAAIACTVVSGTGGTINVRSAPGTQYAVIGNLSAGQSYPVLGQFSGGGWYQVSINGQSGWVAASVTRLEGECSTLAPVAAPANARLAATQSPPQPTLQPPPAGGSAPQPTNTPTLTPTIPTLLGPPDLTVTITSVSRLPTYPFVGVEFDIFNEGEDDNAFPFHYLVCVGGHCTEFSEDTSVLPGQHISRNAAIAHEPLPYYGVSPVIVTIDSQSEVIESDEGNNTAVSQVV